MTLPNEPTGTVPAEAPAYEQGSIDDVALPTTSTNTDRTTPARDQSQQAPGESGS